MLRWLASGGGVLCYHSITTTALPAAGVANVSLESFCATVDAVERVGRIVRLRELVERHRAGRSTAGLIAITFDDAYAALEHTVVPVIAARQLPVTIFVVSGAAATGQRFWWDRTDELFPRLSPERWRAFEDAVGVPDSFRQGQPRELGPLRPLRQWILSVHRGRWPPESEPHLASLEQEAGYCTPHHAMTLAALERIASLPYVEFGAHSVTHPVLPLLSDGEVQSEIAGCHAMLRDRFDATLPLLAAPFGLFDARTLRIARAVGMMATLSVENRTIARCLAPDVLPRFVMTKADKRWKVLLRLAGVVERVRDRRWEPATAAYPTLPSSHS